MRMGVAPVRVTLIVVPGWEGTIVGENGPKEEVLHYRQFAKDFCEIHLLHACVNFVPCFDLFELSADGGAE
jgi:hypothetical protein